MSEEKKINKLNGMLVGPILGGGGVAGQSAAKHNYLFLNSPWSGNILVGGAGLVGLVYLFCKRTNTKSWLIIFLAFVADTVLTTIFHWLSEGAKAYNPVDLWPYIL